MQTALGKAVSKRPWSSEEAFHQDGVTAAADAGKDPH